jgi:PKHD-type hydroxylase
MLILKNVLSPAEIKAALFTLKSAAFEDGKATALGDARDVKTTAEARFADPDIAALRAIVRAALEREAGMVSYARPVKWSQIILSRYENGAEYGAHTDSPFMQTEEGQDMRADLSFTVFLSEPASYNGGELVMMGLGGDQRVRPEAGSVVVYPTTLAHRVTPVTRGARYAAVGWIQSRIANTEQREMVCELEQIIANTPVGRPRTGLLNIYANLQKMWSVA